MESRFGIIDNGSEVGKSLRSKQQQEQELRERAAKIDLRKRNRMEKRILLCSMAYQWNSKVDYVMKVCPNAVKVLPPLPAHMNKAGNGMKRQVTFKLEDSTSC